VIPDVLALADFGDLAALVAPRPLLLVSATADPYSADAGAIAEAAAAAGAAVEHERFEGGHGLTRERFERIVEWVVRRA
jgi:predicted esterase